MPAFRFSVIALLGMLICSSARAQSINEPLKSPGSLPKGADGKSLNLNFETGDLTDWTAAGEAWAQQPIKGGIDKNRPFGEGKQSLHTGEYWLGGYEKLRDVPTGTLTSAPFTVSEPWCSFLIGGGAHAETRVELVNAEDGKVFFKVSGLNQEEMRPVVASLANVRGKQIFIRIVDEHTGGWGHVNFDDFRLHAEKPEFKQPVITSKPAVTIAELYPHENLEGELAAKAMQVPPGFKVQLAAQEPEVTQPIAMAFDDRGRLWVVEAHSYPVREEQGQGKDRILIFEDTNLDGRFDSRKVFIEGLNLVSGIEVGFGGVWVGAAPYLMFIPDKNGDDVPDEPAAPISRNGLQFPQDVPASATVLLDGWHYEDTHETLNSFIWGPDGWLYGCHGVFTHSRVGKPGTPDEQRQPLNAGIWRYHPVKHVFEVFAHGTSNPWGVDYNEFGDFFCTACVIPHLYHIIPGARYQRQAGPHFNPHTYDDIKTIARHRHFVGNQWNNDDRRASDDLGGGHAHAGAMIYQGGAWPAEYRGKLFMNNIHGNRLNVDQLIEEGSGYAGDRAPDFLLTGDKWSQMLYLTYGPDGQVYVIDWYDPNQCHHGREEGHDRTNGRIYRITYGDAKPVKVDLASMSDKELYRLAIASENEWYVRHARRLLQERAAAGRISQEAALDLLFHSDEQSPKIAENDVRGQIRFLSVAHLLVGPDHLQRLAAQLSLDDLFKVAPQVRAYAVRLFSESSQLLPETLARRGELARSDNSPVVRLSIAAALQRQPLTERWTILEGLITHKEDAADHNLPLMYWYAMEPLADANPQRALALAMSAGETIPQLREFMIRRLGSGDPENALALLIKGLSQTDDDAVRLTFLRGIHGALRGRSDVAAPAEWEGVYGQLTKPKQTSGSFDVYLETLGVGLLLGNPQAGGPLRRIAVDEAGPPDHRRTALNYLVEARVPELNAVIASLLKGTTLREQALRAAAVLQDPEIAETIILTYGTLNAREQLDARNTLASRAAYAVPLLKAVDKNLIPRADLSADLIRQLRNLDSSEVNDLLQRVWGVVREVAQDRQQLIAHYKQVLGSNPGEARLEHGRAVFVKTCQQCHTLFGTGGKVGPDITGSNRANLDYLLSNVLDPSAVMAKEYQPVVIATDSGRVITGIVKEETSTTVAIQTANELVSVPVAEIEARKQSEKSMMPDDLLRNLSDAEVRNLVAYLASPGQVAVQGTAETLNRFFNGQNLEGWRSTRDEDQSLWSVENGEIIGRSPGLKHNAFLVSELALDDFRFACDVKLVDNSGNSGIQFRSQPLADGEMRGYQADIGQGWWGKLYEESARGLLVNNDAENLIQPGEWNRYEIVAVGGRIRTFLNGQPAVDLDDPLGARSGVIAVQLHSGGPTEVRFRNLELALLSPIPPYAAAGSRPGAWPVSAGGAATGKMVWKKTTLSTIFRSEGCCIADFNNDGRMDITSGSVGYFQSPTRVPGSTSADDWTMFTITEEPHEFNPKGYSDTFMNFAEDRNGDGLLDLIVVDFPGKPTWWFENSGRQGGPWTRNQIIPVTNNESPQYLDVDGDGRRELLAGVENNVMALTVPQSHPQAPWKIHPISMSGAPGTERFSHGVGAGDINGDGRNDIVIINGWWEAPANPEETPWEFHPVNFGKPCSQMHVYDFDGDGDADVLSSSAHAFGIWWHEQTAPGEFTTHLIDESFSQTHANVLADINGDGLPDFVTGMRYWAHGGNDPGEDQPPVLFWYELSRKDGRPVWTRHLIDDNSGVGTQFDVADINGDGLLDVVTSNKRGTFVFEQFRE